MAGGEGCDLGMTQPQASVGGCCLVRFPNPHYVVTKGSHPLPIVQFFSVFHPRVKDKEKHCEMISMQNQGAMHTQCLLGQASITVGAMFCKTGGIIILDVSFFPEQF